MEYCDKCRQHWDWPKTDYGPIAACELCGTRGKCHIVDAWKLPLPDHRRLQVLTTEEMPKEWADCMKVSAAINQEIMDVIAELSEMQKTSKKHSDYIQLINKIYFGGGLGDGESTILVV